jgi:hypothetical protein
LPGPTIPAPRPWRAWSVMRLARNDYRILVTSRITE